MKNVEIRCTDQWLFICVKMTPIWRQLCSQEWLLPFFHLQYQCDKPRSPAASFTVWMSVTDLLTAAEEVSGPAKMSQLQLNHGGQFISFVQLNWKSVISRLLQENVINSEFSP